MHSIWFENIKFVVAMMLSPLWICLWIQVSAIVMWYRQNKTAALRMFRLGSIVMVLGGLAGWSYESRRQAEFVYQPFVAADDENKLSAPLVVVLGTGFNSDPELPFTSQVSGTFLARLLEGVRIQQQYPDAKMLVSVAGRAEPEKKERFFQQMVELLKLDPALVELLTSAKSTEDEAASVRKLSTGQPIIVVTSAGHMPRAIKTFEVEGLAPIAAPTDYGFPRAGSPDEKIWQRWLPSADGIGSNHQWLYEKVALVWQIVKPR
jgi:uncharacterized SAM-binding protein YcdF (DUF218 family)